MAVADIRNDPARRGATLGTHPFRADRAGGSPSAERVLVRGGLIVSLDSEMGDLVGDLLIEGEHIVAIAPVIDSAADHVIDARGMMVIPGMFNTHIHMWQAPLRGLAANCGDESYLHTIHPYSSKFDPEDMYVATYAQAVDLLAQGVTTVLDFCHSVHSAEHAAAAVAALQDSGIRALFGYSFRDRPGKNSSGFKTHKDRLRGAHRVRSNELAGNGRVQLALALNNIEQVDEDTWLHEIECARELGALATLHSNFSGQVSEIHGRGLLGPDIVWAHATLVSDEELALLAEHGGVVASTPEQEIGMQGALPVAGRAVERGVATTLGSDVPSAMSSDMFVQMRTLFQIERFRDAQSTFDPRDEPRTTRHGAGLDARTVLRLATSDAARALNLGQVTGSLAPGKQADVVVLSGGPLGLSAGDPSAHVVLQAGAADVDTVIVAGHVRKKAGRLVGVDEGRMRHQLAECRTRLTERAAPR